MWSTRNERAKAHVDVLARATRRDLVLRVGDDLVRVEPRFVAMHRDIPKHSVVDET